MDVFHVKLVVSLMKLADILNLKGLVQVVKALNLAASPIGLMFEFP